MLAAESHDREERLAASHPDDLDPLLVVREPRVDVLQAVRVFQGFDGIHEIHAVLAKVISGFAIVPFVLQQCLVLEYR